MPRFHWILSCLVLAAALMLTSLSTAMALEEPPSSPSPKGLPLRLEKVLSLVELQHPLLHGSRTEKLEAQGTLLKALGSFEPVLVNDWELERLRGGGETKNVGFNDTFIQLRHPSGIRGFAGWRTGIGDVDVTDLAVGDRNQALLGIILPLLRGLGTNPERAELEKSKLAEQEALLSIQQTRQDLYLGAATQYWHWVAAWKAVELREQALKVARIRLRQLIRQAETGAVAEFDVIEAQQEVQRRLENVIKAKRDAEQEQFKLSLFVWSNGAPISFDLHTVPDFPSLSSIPERLPVANELEKAIQRRPEILQVSLEAARNNIDLDVAKNNFLPDLQAEASPTRKPGEFVLGLGYHFGVILSFPFLQYNATGQKLQLEAKVEQLRWLQQYRLQQVSVDIENARSALLRAKERIQAASQALLYARSMVKGEQTRFKMGATTLLLVNLRERNVVDAEVTFIQAQTDYYQAFALYRWAVGQWTQPVV